MIIIVNVSEEYYEKIKDAACFGKELLENEGFIHASTCEQFPLIIPRLEKKGGSFMVLYIDTDKLLSIIIEVLQVIANNSEKLSEIVSLLSKALDLNLTDNDISGLSSNNAQIKNKIANALKVQGSTNGLGDSIMNASTESLATAMYSIARA